MSEIEQFSRLVAEIYDASLDPSLWPRVLEKIAGFVPGALSGILLQEGVAKQVHVGFDNGLQAAWNELYLKKYLKLNPMFPALLFCEVGAIVGTSDVVPATQMAKTRFYREYLHPQGLGEAVSVVLAKSATSCAVFTIVLAGSLGRVDEQIRQRVRLLIPHVQRAVLIGKAADPPRAAVETQKAALCPSTFAELIARQFRLTPIELGVMFCIIDIAAVPEAASVLGLSPAVVKAHLLSVLAKTGAKDQADLVRLVAQLANPVAR